MTNTQNQLLEAAEKFITENAIQFRYGKRETFLSDLKRSVEPSHNGFRTTKGMKVPDINQYLNDMIETGLYSSKVSARERYSPGFPVRTESTKNAHRKQSETAIRKALQHSNIVLEPNVSSKVIEALSTHFLPVDDEDKMLSFVKINDTEVGSLPSRERFTLEELLNVTGASRFIDAQASKIASLGHTATLRQTAMAMVPVGSKPAAIEALVSELEAFEKRSLKPGMTIPYVDRLQVEREFTKLGELEGLDRMAIAARVRTGTGHLDDLQPIKGVIQKIEAPKNTTVYEF